VVLIVVTPMTQITSSVVSRQANVYQKVHIFVLPSITAASPENFVAVLMSAVIPPPHPVRFVVLQVIAAAPTLACIQPKYVVVRLPAVLPVSLVVMASAAHLDIVTRTAVTAVHLNVQFLVQVPQGVLSVVGQIPYVATRVSAQMVIFVVLILTMTCCAVRQVWQIVMILIVFLYARAIVHFVVLAVVTLILHVAEVIPAV
jgi:hypothetical protein